MSGAPGVTRILTPSAPAGDGAPWYLSSAVVVGCCVGESAFFGVAAAFARTAATCAVGNGAARVAPRVHRVGERVRDLLVGELRHRGHDGVVLGVVHDDFALQPVHDHAYRAVLVLQQVVRTGERREGARQALAVGLVAGHARDLEYLLALGDLGCDGRCARDLGLVDLLRPGWRGQCERTGDGERNRRPLIRNDAWQSWMAPVIWNSRGQIAAATSVTDLRRLAGPPH